MASKTATLDGLNVVLQLNDFFFGGQHLKFTGGPVVQQPSVAIGNGHGCWRDCR